MPFLAPIAAPLIGAAGSVLGGLFGGKAASKQTPQELAAANDLTANAKTAGTAGANFLSAAPSTISSGLDALNTSKGFWQSILQGGPAATSVLGPQIARTTGTYDNALTALRAIAPRSGMTTQNASDLPFQKAGAITSLYQTLMGQAPQNLASVGGQIANVGTNQANLGYSGLNSSDDVYRAILGYEQKRRQDAAQAGAGIGGSLAQILFSPGVQGGLGKIFNSGKPSSSNSGQYGTPGAPF